MGVVVRGLDMPWLVNLPLRPELKSKAEFPGGTRAGVEEHGCADASLYRRFHQVGLTRVKMFPQLGVFGISSPAPLQFVQSGILVALSQEERKEWEAAVAEAGATFCIALSFHCAVGAKP